MCNGGCLLGSARHDPPQRAYSLTPPDSRLVLSVDSRQVDLERRAATELAVDQQESTALLHDAVHRGEAKAGPLPLLLRREERLEDPVLYLGRHAAPRVAHRDHDVLPR